jgi:hypothetical protein
MRRLFAALLFALVAVPFFGASPQSGEGPEERLYDVTEYEAPWRLRDMNEDGTPDYAAIINARGVKFKEAIDFNADGFMDDFYFYEEGILVRQEIDSNFDQHIDIWVFLSEGIYVKEWRRDLDYDGTVDLQRAYAEGPDS